MRDTGNGILKSLLVLYWDPPTPLRGAEYVRVDSGPGGKLRRLIPEETKGRERDPRGSDTEREPSVKPTGT